MAIQRYSTPSIHITVDPTVVADIWVTLSEGDRDELITYTRNDLIQDANGFTLKLKQEDTAQLQRGSNAIVLIQARVLFTDGTEMGSDIYQTNVGEVLKEGIIT